MSKEGLSGQKPPNVIIGFNLKKAFLFFFVFSIFMEAKAGLLNEAENYLKMLKKMSFLKERKSSLERPTQCVYKEELEEEKKEKGSSGQN